MGLYDNVKAEVGLPDGFTGPLQTKDLDCYLEDYIIRADGRLMKRGSWIERKDSEGSETDTNFHGILNFYALDKEKVWHEYNAKFTDGKLVEIVCVIDP